MKTYAPSWLPIYTSFKTRLWEAEVHAVLEAKTAFNSLIFGLFIYFFKRCPKGPKKNHEACLHSPDCKFWIGPEGLFRTCQLCLRSCSVHIFGNRWRKNRSFTKWQKCSLNSNKYCFLILNGKYLKTAISEPIGNKSEFWGHILFSNF